MKRILIGLTVLAATVYCTAAEKNVKFQFKQKKDDAYSYISTVEEDVY